MPREDLLLKEKQLKNIKISVVDNFEELGEQSFAMLALSALELSQQTQSNPSIDKRKEVN